MKVFLDTNVLIASFISHGACKELFEHLLTSHTVVVSDFVLKEFEEKLTGKLKFPGHMASEAARFIESGALVMKTPKDVKNRCRDRDDDKILAAAEKAGVGCIVTGDEDLLVLKSCNGIPILTPKDFWQFEKERGTSR